MSNYHIERGSRGILVRLTGDFTSAITSDLQAALKSELAAGMADVEFDLAGAEMLDSTGIGLLIAASNSLSRGKAALRVSGVSRDILKLLESMRLVARLNVTARAA